MPELKRPLESSDSTALVLAKKPRNELVEVTDKSKALVQSVSLDHRSLIIKEALPKDHEKDILFLCIFQGPARTSNMDAPIMLLTGHQGEIYTAKFHPEGNVIASAGFDRQICKTFSTYFR